MTVKNYLVALKTALGWAVEQKLIPALPNFPTIKVPKKKPQPVAAEAFERLLAFTNLAPFTGRLAGRLSGGMKQKLGLACALVHPPALLLLDEPSVGVDPISRRADAHGNFRTQPDYQ